MFKFFYVLFGTIVLVTSTIVNIGYAGSSGTTSSGWNSHSSGLSWGGSTGSTGGFSSGGSHK